MVYCRKIYGTPIEIIDVYIGGLWMNVNDENYCVLVAHWRRNILMNSENTHDKADLFSNNWLLLLFSLYREPRGSPD